MRNTVLAAAMIVVASWLAGCGEKAQAPGGDTEPEARVSVLPLSVLDSVSDINTARVDSAVAAGNPRDLGVAFHYYFQMSATDRTKIKRAIAIYDMLKAAAPDSCGSVLYDLSKEIERANYGRMVDRQIEYMRSVSYLDGDKGSAEAGESVSL